MTQMRALFFAVLISLRTTYFLVLSASKVEHYVIEAHAHGFSELLQKPSESTAAPFLRGTPLTITETQLLVSPPVAAVSTPGKISRHVEVTADLSQLPSYTSTSDNEGLPLTSEKPPEPMLLPTYESISQDKYYYKSPSDLLQLNVTFDAVIIPSGGLDPTGSPTDPVRARLDQAATLNSVTQYFLSSGACTTLKAPILSPTGHPISEARSDALYMVETHFIPKEKFILEEMSKDTIGNAFFSRIVCDLMQLQTLVVITNKFHMTRVRSAFDWVFRLPKQQSHPTLYYLEAPDAGMSDEDITERNKKERDSLEYFWFETRPSVQNMKDLGDLIYFRHRAYALDENVGTYNVAISKPALKFY